MNTLRLLFVVVALCVLSAPVFAQPPPEAAPKLEEAKRLFREGNALREAGDYEGALARYKESRAHVASVPNVLNAAVCLRQLGRYDEALEHYEVLITEFRDELADRERKIIGPAMKRLHDRVGTLEVRANVTHATLFVDGRIRGELPLTRPLRLLPGTHELRVLRDGYEPYDGEVRVTERKTTVADARLEPLAVAGRLRLDDEALDGAEVFVDGSPVGTAPFDGALAAGEHWVAVRKDDFGTAPTQVIIVKGQIAGLALAMLPLGPQQVITTTPATASVTIGETAIGRGTWRGRLPIGSHTVAVAEEGYISQEVKLLITATTPTSTDIQLLTDEDHPRWGTTQSGLFLLEGFAGGALVPTLDSGAEQSCETLRCPDNPMGTGYLLAAMAAYEFPARVSLGLAGGYLRVRKTLRRELRVTQSLELTPPIDASGVFVYEDTLTLSGPFAGATLGYRYPLGDLVELRSNILFGVVFGTARHEIASSISSGGATAPVIVGGDNDTSALDIFVMPELHLGFRLSGFNVGIGLAVPIFAVVGPDDAHSSAQPQPVSVCHEQPGPGCFQGQTTTEAERAFGPFAAALPSMRVGHSF